MSKFADELVAVNMATLLGFSHKSNALLVSYISEPLIGIAASRLMKEEAIRQKIFNSLYFLVIMK